MDKYEGQHVSYHTFSNDKTLLTREDFIDKTLGLEIFDQVSRKQDLLFMPNDMQEYYQTDIIMIGTLMSGEKAGVILKSVPHFFDVFPCKLLDSDIELPEILSMNTLKEIKDKKMKEYLKSIEALRNDTNVIRIEIMTGAIYIRGPKKHLCIRLFFDTRKNRNSALKLCYSDPNLFVTSNYSKTSSIFALHNKYTGIWMKLTKYRQIQYSKYRAATKLKYNFELDFANFVKPDDADIMLNPGNNMIFTFDIETCEVKPEDAENETRAKDDDEEDEEVPNIVSEKKATGIINEDNEIFNIRISIASTAKDKKELLSIGMFRPACAKVIKLNSHGFNVMCRTQKELLLCFGLMFQRLQPDIMVTYNGNGFDIPMVLLQARVEGIFEQFYCMASPLSSDNLDGTYYSKINIGNVSFYANNAGYTFWNRVHTTEIVSGLRQCKEYRVQQKLKKFKVENDREELYHYWKPLGCINIDMLLVCKQANKKSVNNSLSAMLAKKGIPEAKHNLKYDEIWRRWKNSIYYFDNPTPEQLQELTEIDVYCAQDCYCTYLLLCSYSYLSQKRAMCKYTSLPMETVIYNADGVKVICGIMRLCSQIGYHFIENFIHSKELPVNNKHLRYHKVPKDAYNQGALVNVYRTGIVHHIYEKYGMVRMPADAIDAASLYPNAIIRCNLSPECIMYTKPADIDNYVVFHLTELPQEIIDEFGIENHTVYIRNHRNKRENYGILPTYLADLFDDRSRVKKHEAICRNKAQQLKDNFIKENPIDRFLQTVTYSNQIEASKLYNKFIEENIDKSYHQLLQDADTFNAEQQTIKIKMNTVYGCTKYTQNALFCYLIAHVTTWFGRRVITRANDIVKELGCIPCYNDTDSVYFYHNPDKFIDILEKGQDDPKFDKRMVNRSIKLSYGRRDLIGWYTAKYFRSQNKEPQELTYDQLVEITKNEKYHNKVLNLPQKGFNDIFNDLMAEFTGGPQIQFVREETLYPFYIAMKKKYFGVVHLKKFVKEIVLGSLLIRGLSCVSRNTSGFAKKFINEIMIEIAVSRCIDVESIVFNKMKEMYLKEFDLKQYAKYFTYRPNVRNITVQNFVTRMKLLNAKNPDIYKVPAPLATLELVLVKPNSYLNLSGSIKPHSKSELFEYPDVIKSRQLPIDKEFHLRSLYAFCSQLMTYKRFDYYDDNIDVKRYKDLIQRNFVSPYFEEYINSQPHIIKLKRNISFTKNILKDAYCKIIACLHFKYPTVSDLLSIIVKSAGFDKMFTKIKKISSGELHSVLKCMHFAIISHCKKENCLNTTELLHIEVNIIPKYKIFVDEIYNKIEKVFMDAILYSYNTGEFGNMLDYNILNDSDIGILEELRRIIMVFIISYKYRVRVEAMKY